MDSGVKWEGAEGIPLGIRIRCTELLSGLIIMLKVVTCLLID
jgi:hypothetical protein